MEQIDATYHFVSHGPAAQPRAGPGRGAVGWALAGGRAVIDRTRPLHRRPAATRSACVAAPSEETGLPWPASPAAAHVAGRGPGAAVWRACARTVPRFYWQLTHVGMRTGWPVQQRRPPVYRTAQPIGVMTPDVISVTDLVP